MFNEIKKNAIEILYIKEKNLEAYKIDVHEKTSEKISKFEEEELILIVQL